MPSGPPRYQLIEMFEDASRPGVRVARVFYQEAPPTFSGTQPVRIATGIPGLPEIEALRSGNAILIDQSVLGPKGVQQQRMLLDLARRIEQAPKDFLDQIQAGEARLAPPPLPRIEVSEKASDAVRNAGRNGDVSALSAFLTEAREGGYLDVAVRDVREAVAADVVAETRLGESSGFLAAVARNSTIAEEADVVFAHNIGAFKSAPDNAEALASARRVAEEMPDALAGDGGGYGGDGGTIPHAFGGFFDDGGAGRPGGGGFDVEPHGFRPLMLFKDRTKRSTGGVSRDTQVRLAWRLDRSDHDTLILIDKNLMEEAAGIGSDQLHAFVGLSGPVPEHHAGSALKALDPTDIRLIIADDSSPLRRADGIRDVDGDLQLTFRLQGNGMPPPPGGMPPPGGASAALDDPLLGPSGDEGGLMTVILADCDLDGDGDITATENQDCVEDALVYDAESGEFRHLGADSTL
jgi:hypothetical protein